MQIEFFGANCIRVKTKKTTVVFDDNLKSLGQKNITSKEDVACNTNDQIIKTEDKTEVSFYLPGEYEVGDVMISGIPAQAHTDEKGTTNATIYRGITPEIKFVVLGHVNPDLSEDQLEAIGVVDVLFIPVGGNGYTLDSIGAAKLAKRIDAKIVVPTHYDSKSLDYEVPQSSYDEFVSVMGLEVKEVSGAVKLKKANFSEKSEIYIFS